MAGPISPVVVWRGCEDTWSAGAHAFDLDFGDGAPEVEYDLTGFRWACEGFATEAAARAAYGQHHPDPGRYEFVPAGHEDLGRLQAALEACAYRFRLDPAGALVPVPAYSKCTACANPGTAYEYKGRAYDGLTAYRGERLCAACRDARMASEGVDILVRPDGPWREPYLFNTVADRDKVTLWLPPELRGVDGRDLHRLRPRRPRSRPVRDRTPGRPRPTAAGDAG
ncbi:hypothetical protein KDK95_29390 [Actinospica sp. MGRD01-02]|uniref:Uncharacterized protein n=1 Tax=Actinospica acidithermotolerans TaxID=2828514 RepID=A0A941EFM7_9ACTN|nr:hypothetical protein [Actinospica acidithermotolerans]MBR7830451.1 hypothetical protein [Actinospica acidithermotolerans]